MRQHRGWLVAAFMTAAVGCAGDSAPAADVGGVGDAPRFALTAGTPTVAMLTPGREAVVELRGPMAQALVRLNVGPGAITCPVEVSIRETTAPWGHVGPAYEIEPSGLEFAEPVEIEFDLNSIDLPPGTRPESLRVGTVENGRWIRVELPAGNVGHVATPPTDPPRVVSAQLRHLSPCGVVADPREVGGVGRRLEANGIVAETTDDVYARLFVSPTIVTLYVDGGAAGTTQVTLSGLPTGEDHVLYVDGHEDMRTITPGDGGSVTVDVDRSEPHLLWLQEHASTVLIGGPYDACATVGSWTDSTTCTLTADVADNVVIAQSGVTLDCDGHSITPPVKPPPAAGEVLVAQGAGILISKIHDVGVRECHVGGTGAGFGIGIWVYYTDGADIADNVLVENVQGIVAQVSTGVVVHDNQVTDSWVSGIAIQDLASVTAENLPPPLPQVEVWGNTVSQTADSKSTAIDVRGTPAKFINDAVGVMTNGLPPITVHDNVVTGGGNAITLANVLDADVQENDFDGPERGLLILGGGWPSRFWHNNVTASMFGVVDARQPASGGTLPPANYTYKEPPPDGAPPDVPLVEVSWSEQGSWWGHSCGGGGLFTPGVDSNAVHVRDSHAYGARDAWAGGGTPGCPGDRDGDTVQDGVDNCPDVPNPGQEDGEGDGVGDACDVTPPDAPVITSPTAWQKFASGSVAVEGTAEPRTVISVWDAGDFLGTTNAADGGTFSLALAEVLAEGPHYVTAQARDAAGNISWPSQGVPFGVDTVAPGPPMFLSPITGETLPTATPIFTGIAEPGTTIRIFDDDSLVASVTATTYGDFSTSLDAPPSDGDHHLTATATDGAAWVSPPSDVLEISVLVVSAEAPVLGAKGKIALVSLLDDPDPFDPRAAEPSTMLTAVVRVNPAAGLAGSSPNHEFKLDAQWTIREASTGRILAELTGSQALAKGTPTPAVIPLTADWNGQDLVGTPVPTNALYKYDVTIDLIRLWTGPGRGPRCARDEAPTKEDHGRPDPGLPDPGLPACLVDHTFLPNGGTIRTKPLPPLQVRDCTSTFTHPVGGDCQDWITGPGSENAALPMSFFLPVAAGGTGVDTPLGTLWATDQGWPVMDSTGTDLAYMVYGDTAVHNPPGVDLDALFTSCVAACSDEWHRAAHAGEDPVTAACGSYPDGPAADLQCRTYFTLGVPSEWPSHPCEFMCAPKQSLNYFGPWSNAVFFRAQPSETSTYRIAFVEHLAHKHVVHSRDEQPDGVSVGVYTYDYFYVCRGDVPICAPADRVLYFSTGTTTWTPPAESGDPHLAAVLRARRDGTGFYRFESTEPDANWGDTGCRLLFDVPEIATYEPMPSPYCSFHPSASLQPASPHSLTYDYDPVTREPRTTRIERTSNRNVLWGWGSKFAVATPIRDFSDPEDASSLQYLYFVGSGELREDADLNTPSLGALATGRLYLARVRACEEDLRNARFEYFVDRGYEWDGTGIHYRVTWSGSYADAAPLTVPSDLAWVVFHVGSITKHGGRYYMAITADYDWVSGVPLAGMIVLRSRDGYAWESPRRLEYSDIVDHDDSGVPVACLPGSAENKCIQYAMPYGHYWVPDALLGEDGSGADRMAYVFSVWKPYFGYFFDSWFGVVRYPIADEARFRNYNTKMYWYDIVP